MQGVCWLLDWAKEQLPLRNIIVAYCEQKLPEKLGFSSSQSGLAVKEHGKAAKADSCGRSLLHLPTVGWTNSPTNYLNLRA